jgi:adenylyltransferase/sulfurtransferase
VSGPVEVDPKLAPVVIPGRLLNEIYTHALESLPEECCGLLSGKGPGRFDAIHRCRNEMTRLHRQDPVAYPRGGERAFHMNEFDYVRVQRDAEAAGARVTGVYHSHVEAGAYFSDDDQESALQELYPFPKVDHIVIAVMDHAVREVAAFRWVPEERRFEGRTLVVEGP